MSKKPKNLKFLLLVGIGVVLVSTALFKRHMSAQKQEAQANRPEIRLQRATDDAQMAALNGRYGEAIGHLKAARAVVEEALAQKPGERKLLSMRLTLTRRQAQMVARAGLEAEAERAEVARLSASLLRAFPGDERARRLRLEIALERGEDEDKAKARAALQAGLDEVEETIKGLKPADSVRAGLGKGWLKIAELAQAEGDAPAVEAAIARVIVHGEALARGDDPVSGVRGQHSMLSKAAQIAEEMKLPIFKPLLMDLIKLLKLKRRLQGDKGTLSSLAYWTGIAADHAEADAEKIALYGDAIALREALLEQEPKGRADLLRLMNRVAVFHGRAGRFKEGRALYEAAVALTEGQGDAEIKGLRLFILGNLAQLLGKNKAIKDAKRHAKAAYDLGRALRISQPKDEKIQLRAAVAGLRHARLLRAAPQPKPKDALKIAREIKAEVDAFTFESPRLKGLREGLDALLKELR